MSELMGLWRKMPTKDRQWHLLPVALIPLTT